MAHCVWFVAAGLARVTVLGALSLGVGGVMVGCRADSGGAADASRATPLYERLGGEASIAKVVDEFVARAAANPKVNFVRKGTSKEWPATPEAVAYLKRMLVEFIASATGGPQKYTGKTMKESHEGMRITSAEFDALAQDLKGALTLFNVPAREQGELLAIVETTRADIVEAK